MHEKYVKYSSGAVSLPGMSDGYMQNAAGSFIFMRVTEECFATVTCSWNCFFSALILILLFLTNFTFIYFNVCLKDLRILL